MKNALLTLWISLFTHFVVLSDTKAQLVMSDMADNAPKNQTLPKDVGDLFRELFNIKVSKKGDTLPARVFLSAVPALNYSLITGFSGAAITNMSFYTRRDGLTKLSSINTSINYSQYKQFSIVNTVNIWSKRNRWNWVGDWRYYHFHTFTYGLGGLTSLANKDLIRYDNLRLHQTAMTSIGTNLTAGAGYHLDYYWNIKDQPATEGEATAFSSYKQTDNSLSSGLSLNILYDNRRNPINAFHGTYAFLQYRNNLKWLGSDNPWQSLFIDVKNYIALPYNKQHVLAFWNYAWLTLKGKPPYLDLPSTGFDLRANSGRGYAVGRFRGLDMLYSEMEYRFPILRNGLLGAVVFGNIQSFTEPELRRFRSVLPGAGAGLRVKLNKNSQTNIALDYAFGVNGSSGVFFTLGEAF